MPAIPLTEDLLAFRKFLRVGIRDERVKLRKFRRPEDWLELAKLVMARLILFNKRRRTEVRELRVDEYLARPKWNEELGRKMRRALTPIDQQLV